TLDKERFLEKHPTVTLIDRCTSQKQLKQIHCQMLRSGLLDDPFAASKLISLSALSDFSSLAYAQKVFDQMPRPNLFSWNILVRAYASASRPLHSLSLFIRLLHHSPDPPDKFTYPFAIKACADLSDLRLGRGIHGMAVKGNHASDVFVSNSLIRFYSECRCLVAAYRIFETMPRTRRDVVSWNSMINGLVQNKWHDDAMELFHRMVAEEEEEGVEPNGVTMLSVLGICGTKSDLELGKWAHSYVNKNGMEGSLILDNAILDMYTKCGGMKEAREVFDKMEDRDVITWTTMLTGYAKTGDFKAARDLFDALPTKDITSWNALISAYEQRGNAKEAIAIFNELQQSNNDTEPDGVTLVSTLSACSQLGAIELGTRIHNYVKKRGMSLNCHLVTSLIDMYSKCGDLEKAAQVFRSSSHERDVFVWSAMIAAYGMHGCGHDAVELFKKMQEAKVKPSFVTFTNLLSACSHSGLVEEGVELFNQMENVYGIVPRMEHYACLVDILGRAGRLERAVEFIRSMPMTPGSSVWGALLGACKLHKNVELAQLACNNLLEIEPLNDGAMVVLSNLYADLGKWEEVSNLRKRMRETGLKKQTGCSSVEINGTNHEFLVGDTTHPLSKKIYLKLEEIAAELKSAGYVPDKSQVLQQVEEEDIQEKSLYHHSERLALALGLISLAPSQPIRIVKNLRVCEDCHCVFKLVSRIYDREIVLRDRYRFHLFRKGCCSCKEYW
ncbi:hypothetical protein M569_05691, partial [Genlisea aurea]